MGVTGQFERVLLVFWVWLVFRRFIPNTSHKPIHLLLPPKSRLRPCLHINHPPPHLLLPPSLLHKLRFFLVLRQRLTLPQLVRQHVFQTLIPVELTEKADGEFVGGAAEEGGIRSYAGREEL